MRASRRSFRTSVTGALRPPLLQLTALAAVLTALTACGDGAAVTGAPRAKVASIPGLPDHDALRAALVAARNSPNGGLGFDMWAAVVDRTGTVVDVVFTGTDVGDQWPGSRVISAQKANTANAFSLTGFALSTANLYWPTQPGQSLFGLQESNPVDPSVAYGGKTSDYGSTKDFMIGKKIGGINVFGGGLALYGPGGVLLGALGVSGDTSCADHNIAWKLRDGIGLDFVPHGVSATDDDNIVYDIAGGVSAGGFGHPQCSPASTAIGNALPVTNPTS